MIAIAEKTPTSVPFFQMIKGALRPMEDRAEVALAITALDDVVKVPFPGKTVFFLRNPRDFRRVLAENAKNYRKSFDYRFFARLLGQGLIVSEEEIWRKDRRLIQPLFHHKMIAHFSNTITELTRQRIATWSVPASASPTVETVIDVSAEMMELGLAVMGHRVFSRDVSADAKRIVPLIAEIQRYLIQLSAAPIEWANYWPTPGSRKLKAQIAELDQIFGAYIEDRLKNPLPESSDEDEIDLLSILIREGYDARFIRDHVTTFFVAGFETTAVAMAWTLHLLSLNSDCQDRSASESASVSPDATWDGRGTPYLRSVIDESLRIYPPLPLVGREALNDDVVGGVKIPAGSTVVVSILAAHRDPKYWPDPLRFDPERFNPARGDEIPRHAFLPFGAGPRACIGAQFALMEMQMVIGELLREFHFNPVDRKPFKAIPLASFRPNRPIQLRVSRR